MKRTSNSYPERGSVLLNGEDVTEAIRAPEISEAASKVSLVPAVRRAMVAKQREIGGAFSVVMEGRDIGSVVFPDATVKIFLDAQPEVRAERRARRIRAASGRGRANKSASATSATARVPNLPWCRLPMPSMWIPRACAIDEVEAALLKIIRDRTSNGKERTH